MVYTINITGLEPGPPVVVRRRVGKSLHHNRMVIDSVSQLARYYKPFKSTQRKPILILSVELMFKICS